MRKLLDQFVNLYPVWIVTSSLIGFIYPPSFAWFTGDLMVYALAIVMLGMGLTINVDDFKQLKKMPGAIVLVAFLQYSIMPLTAWAIAKFLNLAPELAVGLIIVGCCPGGTASNVIAYLARGHLALSITMTTVSTILAIALTPILTDALAGTYVPVDAWGLFFTTVKVILIPVGLGVFLNYKYEAQVSKVRFTGPVLAVMAIVFIAGGIVAQSADTIASHALKLFAATTSLHIVGFILGYFLTKIVNYDKIVSRTAAIEVGMQNGGLAATLAKQHFPLYPLAAVPAVFSSVMQTIIGGLLAAWWRSRPIQEDPNTLPVQVEENAL